MNIFDLTAHQLDVIRTGASVVGAIGGFFGGVGAVAAFLARYWAKQAANNTKTKDWKGGKLVETTVAETARHLALGVPDTPDLGDQADWSRGPGRRREPTRDVPRIDPRSDR